MRLSRNFLQSKMNKDLDERLLPQGQYSHAENIRVSNSEGSNIGSIENVYGNKQITNFNLGTNPVRIGSCLDKANGFIYWMVASDEGSYLLEYDVVNRTQALILEDTRDGLDNVLNFKSSNLITDARVLIDSDNNRRFLLFTDNLNPIRQINIERAKTYGASDFTNEQISLIKAPPINPPEISLVEGDSLSENNIKDKFLIFSHRYEYIDGERSAISPFSEPAFAPDLFDFDYSTSTNNSMVNINVSVNIKINTGSKLVKSIELVAKEVDSNTLYSIGTYNKEDKEWVDNEHYSIKFNNNKNFKVIPPSQLDRLFDNVPNKAKALEIINNRLILGNYTEGYNLKDASNDNVIPKISLDFYSEALPVGQGYSTNKSDRDYEVGIVYGEDFGRHTTVLPAEESTTHIPISSSDKKNTLRVTLSNNPPKFASWYRFYIKQNKGVHDTVVPTTFYVDGAFIWLKINSSDTDKVKEGDFLIVKKDSVGVSKNKVEVKVLEKKVQEKNFLEIEDSTTLKQQSGLYIRVKSTGFNIEPSVLTIHDQTFLTKSGLTGVIRDNTSSYLTPLYFYGIGINDLSISGTYTGSDDNRYTIIFDSANTFAWSSTSGNAASNIPFSAGNPVLIEEGVSITFGSSSGYNITDKWTFSAKAVSPNFFSNTNRAFGFFESLSTGFIEAGSSITINYNEFNESNQKFEYTFTTSKDYESLEEWFWEDNALSKMSELSGESQKYRFRNGKINVLNAVAYVDVSEDMSGTDYLIIGSEGIKNNPQDGTPKIKANIVISPPTNLVLETRGEELNSDKYFEIGETYRIEGGKHLGKEGDVSQTNVSAAVINLKTYNTFGWGNGVESSKIKGAFLSNKITNETRALTTVEDYRENKRIASLTYSGIYEQSTNFNALNEFNTSLSNFKDLDDSYGSIQKLFSKDNNLIVFQENKTFNVLYNKSIVYNADGTGNISQSQEVLGQEVPAAGEYGIGKNPESFSFYGNKIWHADSNRGCILRLGGDGYTEISKYGMSDYFRDYFRNYRGKTRFGGYDPHHDEYVLQLPEEDIVLTNISPSVGNLNLTLTNREEKIFSEDDFTLNTKPNYFDPEGDLPKNLKVDSLPSVGELTYNTVPVTEGQVFLLSDLEGNTLKYYGGDLDVTYSDSFNFKVSDVGSDKFSGVGTVFISGLSSSWSVSDITKFSTGQLPNTEQSIEGIYVKPSGDKLYLLDNSSGKIKEYSLTSRDLNTLSYIGESTSIYSHHSYSTKSVVGLDFSNSGGLLFTIEDGSSTGNIRLKKHTLSTPWSVLSGSLNTTPTQYEFIPKVSGKDVPKGFRFTDSGNYFIYTFETIEQGFVKSYYRVYSCVAPFDITNPTLVLEQEVEGVTNINHPFSFNKSGVEASWDNIDPLNTFLVSYCSGSLRHIDYIQKDLIKPLTGIGDVKQITLVNNQYLMVFSGVDTLTIYDLNLLTFDSIDFTPPSNPTTLTLSNVTTSGYRITSGVSVDATTPPVEYRLYRDGSAYSNWQSSNVFDITGDSIGTQRSWKAKSRDSALVPNESSFTTPYVFSTLTAAPSLIFFDKSSSSITFDVGSVVGGSVYRIEYKKSGQVNWTLLSDNFIGGRETLSGLLPSTSYDIRALAYNINNNPSGYSVTLTQSTDADTGGTNPNYTEVIMSPTGSMTSTESCNTSVSVSRYHDGNLPFAGVGDYVYEDSNGGTVFNGGSLWYKMDNGFSVQVDSQGLILNIVECQ